MNYEIIQGDCIQTMKGLPAGSVQTCVTSPPYYGLRDYQTATWQGGNSACDHVQKFNRNDGNRQGADGFAGSASREGHAHMGAKQFAGICGKCGARRIDSQIGLEETPEMYVAKLVDVFREVRRVLRDDGTLWLNLGDSYASTPAGNTDATWTAKQASNAGSEVRRTRSTVAPGIKPKDLIGIPWLVAFALRADGWWLRSDIIWSKPNPMPESVRDRPTKAHEYIFLLSKSSSYFYDADAIAEPASMDSGFAKQRLKGVANWANREGIDVNGGNQGNNKVWTDTATRNRRSVWTVTTKPYSGAHFATFPPDLIEPCILAGSKAGDTVLDPFNGSGTTGAVALKHGRKYIGCELNPDYIELAHDRIRRSQPMLLEVTA